MFELVPETELIPADIPTRYHVNGSEWLVAREMKAGMPFNVVCDDYFNDDRCNAPGLWPIYARANQSIDVNATQAFHDVTHPEMVVVMPVATHQEGTNIQNTLEQYVEQQDAPPHQIVLFCNHPSSSDKLKVNETLSAIKEFKADHPEIPLSYFEVSFPVSMTIGGLRKLLWDTVLYRYKDSVRSDDIIMLNHDADITYMSVKYLKAMKEGFKTSPNRALIAAAYPRSAHQRSDGRLPNMDTVNAWYDLDVRSRQQYFEMGFAISARAYMAAKGYNPNKKVGETIDLIKRISEGEGAQAVIKHPGVRYVKRALIKSSSRRLYNALSLGKTTNGFWTDTFGPDDAYRVQSEGSIHDINEHERDRLVSGIITGEGGKFSVTDSYLAQYFLKEGYDLKRAYQQTERFYSAARFLLGGPEDTVKIAAIGSSIVKVLRLIREAEYEEAADT